MPRPGEVFYLPPEPDEPATKGDRPHVLLSLTRPDSGVLTLAYGSTKPNDAAYGAEHVLIDPRSKGFSGSGFTRATYLYTSRLVSAVAEDLGPVGGSLAGQMAVEIQDTRWLGPLSASYPAATLAVQMVATTFQPVYITKFLGAVIPRERDGTGRTSARGAFWAGAIRAVMKRLARKQIRSPARCRGAFSFC